MVIDRIIDKLSSIKIGSFKSYVIVVSTLACSRSMWVLTAYSNMQITTYYYLIYYY